MASYNKFITKKVQSSSPSNIALVKYWGKIAKQRPCNSSLSLTLRHSQTISSLTFSPKKEKGPQRVFLFENLENPSFLSRIEKYFQEYSNELMYLKDFDLVIESRNTFPHSAGIASSASSMSSLALNLTSMEEIIFDKKSDEETFLKKGLSPFSLSEWQRLPFSFSPFSYWGKESDFATSFEGSDFFNTLQDAIIIVSSEKKAMTSSFGHKLMDHHPYREARFHQAETNCDNLKSILKKYDFEKFRDIVEEESMSLHSLMMSSTPSHIFIKPLTLEIIDLIKKWRDKTCEKVAMTLDAGPNIHLLYPLESKEKVDLFLKEEVGPLVENIIFDERGDGPKWEIL